MNSPERVLDKPTMRNLEWLYRRTSDLGVQISIANNRVRAYSSNPSRSISFPIFDVDVTCVPGTGMTGFVVPEHIDGFNLVAATAAVAIKGVGGTMTLQFVRRRAGVLSNMLATELSIGDAYWSDALVINGSYDDVAQGDLVTVNVNTVHTIVSAIGLSVVLTFEE